MSALHCGYCTFAESVVPAFFKVSIDHLFDNRASVRIKHCFWEKSEKSLKVWIQKSVRTLWRFVASSRHLMICVSLINHCFPTE